MTAEARGANKASASPSPVPQFKERADGLIARQVRIQGAMVVLVYVIALPWLNIPEIPLLVRAFVAWVVLSVLIAVLFITSRKSARTMAAMYHRAVKELEQDVHDRAFREQTSSILDKTTGSYAPEYFYARLKEELDRTRRNGRPLTLVLLDLEHFHKINQQYGRIMGNQILRRFALNILRPSVRSVDVVARFGGDEFVVLMPETAPEQAEAVIQRIAETALTGTVLADGHRLPLRASSGVASAPRDGNTVPELIAAAEQALLKAKSASASAVQPVLPAGAPASAAASRDGKARVAHDGAPVKTVTAAIKESAEPSS